MLLHNPWLILAGFFIMIGAQIEDPGSLSSSPLWIQFECAVMLTDFRHSSRPLTSRWLTHWSRIACIRCKRIFRWCGVRNWLALVSRQRIVDALRSDGNGYIQMSR